MTNTRQIIRYGITGLIGTTVHFGTLFFLVEIYAVDAVKASSCGFILTVIISYILNYFWTFKTRGNHLPTFIKYLSVSCSGLLLNALIMHVGVNNFGFHYGISQAFVVLVIPLTNYLINHYWTFAGRVGERS
ncbi:MULTISPECIES: GtrA family protein [unclassified Marinobacter]|uniref:GtrA family protein n=1 Tax=unclassified Marinobacter TaxID=83889 RepID=UPI00200C1FA1|nr:MULTISPECIES: GtrA family protein [unclassified Marinobacter]UQG54442.1 GtrA family protein [Marinobacter sp. M4C]UQG63247.1 GtrA family protein [Marinobacter sp. M2C]UQG67527.1 GtrA family protein [Marinobacter sp. M1C]